MRRRPLPVLHLPEYPRPVMPADLDEDQQDAVLDRLMTELIMGRPHPGVRVVAGGDWTLDDDVVEF